MANVNFLDRMDRLVDLIKRKATGPALELATKLGVSERSVYDLINKLRDQGCPISYDQYRRTYYFEKDGEILFRFRERK